jgi:hypothetical protein
MHELKGFIQIGVVATRNQPMLLTRTFDRGSQSNRGERHYFESADSPGFPAQVLPTTSIRRDEHFTKHAISTTEATR